MNSFRCIHVADQQAIEHAAAAAAADYRVYIEIEWIHLQMQMLDAKPFHSFQTHLKAWTFTFPVFLVFSILMLHFS